MWKRIERIQEKRLMGLDKQKLELIRLEDIKNIKSILEELGCNNNITSNTTKLVDGFYISGNQREYFKNYYGVEWKYIQKEYEKLLPKIKKYLNPNWGRKR